MYVQGGHALCQCVGCVQRLCVLAAVGSGHCIRTSPACGRSIRANPACGRRIPDILGRVLHINKFQHLHLISGLLEHRSAQPVRDQRGHPLLQKTVFEHRLQHIILKLAVQLMLAARNREDRLRAPADGLRKRIA